MSSSEHYEAAVRHAEAAEAAAREIAETFIPGPERDKATAEYHRLVRLAELRIELARLAEELTSGHRRGGRQATALGAALAAAEQQSPSTTS
jgi:hypothetical protein